MKMLVRAALALFALSSCPALAVTPLPQVQNAAGVNVPSQAALQIDANGNAILAPAPGTALSGTTTSSTTAGPFAPQLGRQIWLTLTGTWSGSVAVTRTIDGICADAAPLTVAGTTWASFTTNANEQVAQESASGASYCLTITVSSGSVTYRLAQ